MLTSFQASPIAYWPVDDEGNCSGDGPVCSECAWAEAKGRTAQDEGQDVDEMFIHYYNTPAGFQPASRYGVEEAYPDGVDCVRCGAVIVEPWPEEGDEPEGFNPPAPRWVPCSSCHAGDGEPHREGCSHLNA